MQFDIQQILKEPKTRWLLTVAHPDDEIAVAGLLCRLTKQGNVVGALWAHSTPVRKAESQNAAGLIGIAPQNQWYFERTDGRVHREMPQLSDHVKEVLDTFQPDAVLALAFEQGHLDHDSVNRVVSYHFSEPILEFPMYHTYMTRFQKLNEFSSPAGVESISLNAEERELKNRLMDCYPSQTLKRNIVAYNILRTLTLNPLHMDRREVVRARPDHDYASPAHGPHIAERLKNHPTWKEWLSALSASGLE